MGWQSANLSLNARGKRCGLDICELWSYIAADEERGFWGLYEKILYKRFKDECIIQTYNVSLR